MSYTSFGVNDAMAVKLWSKNLAAAERDTLDIAPLMGDDANSIIQMKTETKKGAGDKVTFGLRTRLTGEGKTEKVQEIINKTEGFEKYPASLVAPDSENLHWFLDAAAAKGITSDRV